MKNTVNGIDEDRIVDRVNMEKYLWLAVDTRAKAHIREAYQWQSEQC